ncbi:MAG: lytic transglycosylase domain-containing protein [archaeon]
MINRDCATKKDRKQLGKKLSFKENLVLTALGVLGVALGSAYFLKCSEPAEGSINSRKHNPAPIAAQGEMKSQDYDDREKAMLRYVELSKAADKEREGKNSQLEGMANSETSSTKAIQIEQQKLEAKTDERIAKIPKEQNPKKYYTKAELKAIAREVYEDIGLPRHWKKEYYDILVSIESNWSGNPFLKSSAGALGPAQVMKDTHLAMMGKPYDGDPKDNFTASMLYIWDAYKFNSKRPWYRQLDDQGKLDNDLAFYNLGQTKFEKIRFDYKKINETRNYVKKHRQLRNKTFARSEK